jgi:hypothetical protein
MLGFEDKWVALVYVLCLGSALLCLAYGWWNWSRGEEEIQQDDIRWAEQEDKAEDKL